MIQIVFVRRAGRIAKNIDGRIADSVITGDGRKIGWLDHIFKDMINIREAHVAQDHLDMVAFRIFRGARYTGCDGRLLVQEACQRLGGVIGTYLEYVESLRRYNTHKLRFVLSTLPEAHVAPAATRA